MKERVDPLLLPHRPARTSEKTPPRSTHSPPVRPFNTRVEYHRRDLQSGVIRVISRSGDSVFVERTTKDGVRVGDFRFGRGPQSLLLERAVELAYAPTSTKDERSVGRFVLASGAAVDVGVSPECVLVRWLPYRGAPRNVNRLSGSELEALRRALIDLHDDAARRPL